MGVWRKFPSKVNRIGIEGGFGGFVGEGLGVVDGELGSECRVSEARMLERLTMRPAVLFANEGQERVGEGYDGEEVGFEDGVEDILRDLAGRDGGTAAGETAFGEAGVVDEDVEASVAGVEVVVGGLVIGGLVMSNWRAAASMPSWRSFAAAASPRWRSREPMTTLTPTVPSSSAV